MQGVYIYQDVLDSYVGTSRIVAVTTTESAAMKWIQDEVDGKHNSGHAYASGKPAEWWTKEYPLFRLVSQEIFED